MLEAGVGGSAFLLEAGVGGGESTDLPKPTTSNGTFSEVVSESNLYGDFGGGDIGGSFNHFFQTLCIIALYSSCDRDLINLYL